MTNNLFRYETESKIGDGPNFTPDVSSEFIEAENPMAALEEVVKRYQNPRGLFTAKVSTLKNQILARYLSREAGAQYLANHPTGTWVWRNGALYVEEKTIPERLGVNDESWEDTTAHPGRMGYYEKTD